jgi:hypothetical protein
LSKRKTTKKKTTKKKKPSLVTTRGMGLSIKLFKFSDLGMTSTQLVKTLKARAYKPTKKTDIASGFSKVKATGKVISAEFLASFRVPVLTFDTSGSLKTIHHISVDKGQAFIKMDRGTIEFRGSSRVANKFKNLVEDETGAKVSPLNLDGGTKKLYDEAADVASVLLTGVEKGNLTQAEFRGVGIQTEEEIGLYTRRYKGQISRFRGTFPYPSGAFLTTTVNADAGSLMIYKSGEGILEKDLTWIVELMENAALAAR